MNTERASSHHGVHHSVPGLGTNHSEGIWQDKSRKVLGGRTGKKSRNNNVRGKGAPTSTTLLHATNRWKIYELDTLRFDAP